MGTLPCSGTKTPETTELLQKKHKTGCVQTQSVVSYISSILPKRQKYGEEKVYDTGNRDPRRAERARHCGQHRQNGTLNVFATPALVALAEKTCWMSVADALGEGNGSVGTKLELEHTAPTPVGMTVTCESELVAVEGRKLTFKVTLHDEKGTVGGGTHERFVINNEKFAAKAEAKKG